MASNVYVWEWASLELIIFFLIMVSDVYFGLFMQLVRSDILNFVVENCCSFVYDENNFEDRF